MGYSKLGRSSDQRKALIRDLITDLIINESIEINTRFLMIHFIWNPPYFLT